jgi:hypothetical protein
MHVFLTRILFILFATTLAFSLPLEVLAKGGGHGGRTSTGNRTSTGSKATSGTTTSKGSETSVRGYTRKDGTYVAPHQRTTPDGTKGNNWSTKGNVNPYTGKPGTKEP